MVTRVASTGQLSLLGECLTPAERAILGFASTHHRRRATPQQVQAVLGLTPTQYYQQLLALLDRPEAHDTDPDLISALRTARDQHRQRRYRR